MSRTKEEKSAAMRAWGKKNPDRVKKIKADSIARNPEKFKERNRNWRLKNYYGITLDQYNEMFAIQGGCCFICSTHASEMKKGLVVDHCHSSGKIRNLLCQNCNSLIGMAKENTETLELAIKYLRSHK